MPQPLPRIAASPDLFASLSDDSLRLIFEKAGAWSPELKRANCGMLAASGNGKDSSEAQRLTCAVVCKRWRRLVGPIEYTIFSLTDMYRVASLPNTLITLRLRETCSGTGAQQLSRPGLRTMELLAAASDSLSGLRNLFLHNVTGWEYMPLLRSLARLVVHYDTRVEQMPPSHWRPAQPLTFWDALPSLVTLVVSGNNKSAFRRHADLASLGQPPASLRVIKMDLSTSTGDRPFCETAGTQLYPGICTQQQCSATCVL
eukprot:TRINITY_DN13536_c0_g4_i1.p1 TRINITY_DN13536_c0_g4~~TRINITY_DN13536_c0_g4_i1.p1  ORF type:complete len:279 (-),score=23.23 TRINITY_DN13536_c0_g4_i1:433-1206(-)